MDYEKKYKEALEWMRGEYKHLLGSVKEDAERYFPELKESEDERIRKEIYDFIFDGIWHQKIIDKVKQTQGYARWLSWLKKQKEQKPAEWNEDNKLPIDAAIYWLERRLEAEEACDISTRTCPLTMRETIEKLKSLRPQPHWKPSEEQMYVLNRAISELESKEHIAENYAPLKKLRDQLKKLL